MLSALRPGLAVLLAATPLTLAVGQTPLTDQLRAAAQDQATTGFTGTVLVVRDQDTLLLQAFGTGITPNSRFWLASLQKQFVSAAILRCHERGLLSLSDSLGRFFTTVPPDKAAIPLRHLLSHSSGLPQAYAAEGAPTRDEAVRRILAQPLVAAPGTRFNYSNDNFQLAAAIVETVTHRPYAEFLRSELFLAAGLHDTGRPQPADLRLVARTPSPPPVRLKCLQWCGADGFVSSARDLYAWYHALSTGAVLTPASIRELFHPVVPLQSGGGAALGWFVDTTSTGRLRYFIRGNDSWGPNGLLYAYPETHLTIVVLSHAGAERPGLSASRAMHRALERVLSP